MLRMMLVLFHRDKRREEGSCSGSENKDQKGNDEVIVVNK